jgi:uncharacterized protein YacL
MSDNKAILEGEVDTDKLKKKLEAWWIIKGKNKWMKSAPALAMLFSTMLSTYLSQFDLSYLMSFIIILASAMIVFCFFMVIDLQRRLDAVINILHNLKSKTG